MMPRATVSVITYPGGEKYLQETIDSVNDQTFKDFKLIVTNDDRNNTVKWNEAIDQCDTEYLWLFHHDDVALPGFLETMIAALDAQPETAAAFCHDFIIDQTGKRVGQTECGIPPKPLYSYRDIIDYSFRYGNIIRCPSFTLRMSMFKDDQDLRHCLDPEKYGTAGDTALWCRITAKHPIIILPDKLYKYRVHPDSDTQKNVANTMKQFDGRKALEAGMVLKPKELTWTSWVGLAKAKRGEAIYVEGERLKQRRKDSKQTRFIVVHEPPYANGTGVLAAERVKLLNNKDNEWFNWYVYPNETPFIGFMEGVPVVTCKPGNYGEIIRQQNVSYIEFHHYLGWPLEFLALLGPKSLWLHDAATWCMRYHLYDGEKTCSGPEDEKCAKCMGISKDDVIKWRQTFKEIIPTFKQVFANSEWTAKGFEEQYGIKPDIFKPYWEPLVPHPERKRIGFFGNWYQVKGTDIILEAIRQLPDCDLLMFSKNVPPELLEGRRLIGYNNTYVFNGYNRADLPFLARLVDLCVVPSLIESYGLVARELRECGAKVICSTAGGMEEIGTFEPGSVDALVKAIRGVDVDALYGNYLESPSGDLIRIR